MNSEELKKLAQRARYMRESGFALLISSLILGGFLFVPLFSVPTSPVIVDTSKSVPSAFANVPIEASAAVVYDLATKETLFSHNATAQLPLASLTKLLTVYTALSTIEPSTTITIPEEAVLTDPPRALRVGQSFSLEDLSRITLTASLNDGAAAIAAAAAAREGRPQTEALASAAAALGLSQTFALNGSGLDETTSVSGAYGSAMDLAVVSGALLSKAPNVAEATTRSSVSAVSLGGTSVSVNNTDPFVGTIPHLLLSKTGFTDLAGGNLALVLDVGINHPVAIVVLGSSKSARFTDGMKLVAATLAHFAGVPSL